MGTPREGVTAGSGCLGMLPTGLGGSRTDGIVASSCLGGVGRKVVRSE